MLLCILSRPIPAKARIPLAMSDQITFKELRIRAGLKIAKLARAADISPSSIYRIEDGEKVTRELVQSALNVINNRLHTSYTVDDLSGLNL
jgi:DNA-binding XRE family transcriptional regulator